MRPDFTATAMNHSIIAIAVIGSLTVPGIFAAPPLLDFPGPGYREQAKLVSPKRTPKVLPPVIWFGSVHAPDSRTFETANPSQSLPESSDPSQSFSEPIRLFDTTSGGPKTQLK